MPNKCGVVNCKGNYNAENKCTVYRLPSAASVRDTWINCIPKRDNFSIDPRKFFICERHWPSSVKVVALPGGKTRPIEPPSVFDVPPSCLPSKQPKPRVTNKEDAQLHHFMKKDIIVDFLKFTPEKQLEKSHNVLFNRSPEKLVCVFMSSKYERVIMICTVFAKSTLTAPLTVSFDKNNLKVPVSHILLPNNGLRNYSAFFEAVRYALSWEPDLEKRLNLIKEHFSESIDICTDSRLLPRLQFLSRQTELLITKSFTTSDYCFAIEHYPKCDYASLRQVLVLPSKRKMQAITSTVDIDAILRKTFSMVNDLRKHVILLIDEVKIRPRLIFGGGCLNGAAENDPENKATSMLCIMMKCLSRGPSVMISVTPVHRMSARFQFECVKRAAIMIENAGGTVIGSITDNHKVNQHYCKLFKLKSDHCAEHPLDGSRNWFLLYDTVHLLKCVRNNWLTEKSQKLSFDGSIIGDFAHVIAVYKAESSSILKCSSLTRSAVFPSHLELQNVKLVLRVFNEKVISALKLNGYFDTAAFIQQVLDWWDLVNVSSKGQDSRFKNPQRSVQREGSETLSIHLQRFSASKSGHGKDRIQCLTHDTKRALVQTTRGHISICEYLLQAGFKYILLRELQSDRIEGEFSIYRQNTGGNAFMTTTDVMTSYRKRLIRFGASFLHSIEHYEDKVHECVGSMSSDDGLLIEMSLAKIELTEMELSACAYVWMVGNEMRHL